MDILWYVVNRDGRYPWDPSWNRPVGIDYLRALATTIDARGYSGALFATQPNGGLDPFITAASLAAHTRRMRFLLAVHPSLFTPSQLVKLTTTLDHNIGGRLVLNIVNGHTSLAPAGVHLAHDERYRRCDEFLEVYRRMMSGETVDFDGEFIKVSGAKAEFPSLQKPYPPLWFGGSSDVAIDVAAKHIDKYLTWGEPPAETAAVVKDVRARAARHGRRIGFGIRLNLIVRDTDEEAWDAAQQMLDSATDEAIEKVQQNNRKQDAVGQDRQSAFHGGKRPKHARDLELHPNVWSGFGLLRNGPGIAIVGGPEAVAERLIEYKSIGVESFILSGNPFLEEAHRFADQVMPLLPLDDSWQQPHERAEPYAWPSEAKGIPSDKRKPEAA
ncbi:LLM class flavin-dependent oxidoreductase [Aquamicrobium sp. LC103]|uniref:LLM class flavin-dependent oxidoreductase n=1 Tax=Aquamicrobium sp. LC103 TaxID=1120658 RepID=UPI00069A77FB|nr:LLM class flavin-dependent oxidoreductase [Aquamicrobium sp. LC103]TKT69499.1 LLM class flavin-dependent oxidoreductase [Aquamicrobium sp. LC103]